MDYIIRFAEKKDILAMRDLLTDLFSVEEDFRADPAAQERGLDLLLDSGATVLCAEAGGRVIGMMTMQVLVSTAMGARTGLVEDVVVDETWRGRGVATALMDRVVSAARESGCRRLQLVADEKNTPAHRFYSARGWKTTNLRSWMRIL